MCYVAWDIFLQLKVTLSSFWLLNSFAVYHITGRWGKQFLLSRLYFMKLIHVRYLDEAFLV